MPEDFGTRPDCLSCFSTNLARLTAEMAIHHPGIENIDTPALFIFPELAALLNFRLIKMNCACCKKARRLVGKPCVNFHGRLLGAWDNADLASSP